MTPSPGIEPGPHWWEASALTTRLSTVGKSLINLKKKRGVVAVFFSKREKRTRKRAMKNGEERGRVEEGKDPFSTSLLPALASFFSFLRPMPSHASRALVKDHGKHFSTWLQLMSLNRVKNNGGATRDITVELSLKI